MAGRKVEAQFQKELGLLFYHQGARMDPLYIPESAIVNRIPAFAEFTYDNLAPRYPWGLPGVKLPLAPPYQDDCCTFVEALLVKAWADIYPGEFSWSVALHKQMMLLTEGDYFSPVSALIEAGMAVDIEDSPPSGGSPPSDFSQQSGGDAMPLPWTVIQAWRSWVGGGHTFIVVDVDESTGRVLTLESNKSYRLNGPGFRMIGPLGDFNCRPPTRWWEQEDLWTWERFCETYLYRKQCVLNVTGRFFSGL